MQDLYRELEEEGVLSFKEAKSVGDAVFSALLKNIKKPPALILKVKGLGDFFLRRKKLSDQYLKLDALFNTDNLLPDILEKEKKYPGHIAERRATIDLIAQRLEEYERYVDKKLSIRRIREKIQNKNK